MAVNTHEELFDETVMFSDLLTRLGWRTRDCPHRTCRCYAVCLCEEVWILLSPQRWMQSLTQQGALLELQAWLEAAETQLKEGCSRNRHASSTCTDLSRLLRDCRVKQRCHLSARCQLCLSAVCLTVSIRPPQDRQTEMSAHQATLDYVNQLLEIRSTEDGHRWRYEHNRYAEEQGRLNHRWLSLQQTLNSQVRKLSHVLRSWSFRSNMSDLLLLSDPSGPGGGAGAAGLGGAGGPPAADQPLDLGSEPLDGLGSDTQQPGRAATEPRRLPGQRSPPCHLQRYFSHEHVLFLMLLLHDDVISVCVRPARLCRRRSARSLQLFRS